MTWLQIRPQDVWLFRDGKPFSGGEDHAATGIFPPTPFTVQGALRQKISVSLGVSLSDYIHASKGNNQASPNAYESVRYIGKHGSLTELGLFNMGGVFLGQQEGNHLTFLLPTPADLFYSKDDDIPYLPSPTENLITNVQLSADFRFLSVKEGYENLPHSWMTLETFKQYLNHELPTKDNILAKDDIYDTESRFGVSTDSKTSFREEGQLYQIQFVRPKEGICLLVKVDDIPTHLLEGMLQLGGEGRQAYIAPIKNLPFLDRPQQVSGSFKVIFLTPAYFNAGWQPQAENWSALFGGEVMLKSASLYRPLKIGGWSNADRSPRAMYNYVAPGSVYYFEAKETIHLPATLTENPAGIQSERLGFGQYAISRY